MKELQGLPRILDTLAYAFEFIMMPTPSEQAQGLEELRRSILRCYPELKVLYSEITTCLLRFMLSLGLEEAVPKQDVHCTELNICSMSVLALLDTFLGPCRNSRDGSRSHLVYQQQ